LCFFLISNNKLWILHLKLLKIPQITELLVNYYFVCYQFSTRIPTFDVYPIRRARCSMKKIGVWWLYYLSSLTLYYLYFICMSIFYNSALILQVHALIKKHSQIHNSPHNNTITAQHPAEQKIKIRLFYFVFLLLLYQTQLHYVLYDWQFLQRCTTHKNIHLDLYIYICT
jgi:hypothetical protein